MKFTPEVIAALETLRKNAENDFELHRLEVLENDLISPPVVEQVDETHQMFKGVKFCLNTSGHYTKSWSAVHQAVWRYYFGEIPEGYEIHHRDGDKSNNDIYNLQMLTKAEHRKVHFAKPHLRENFKKAFKCDYCHKEFSAIDCGTNRFCSPECKSAFFYRYKKNQVERTCAYCGKIFTTSKYNNTKCCSASCARKLAVQQNLEEVPCPVCGENFFREKNSNKIYCSKKCYEKVNRQKRFEKRICAYCGKTFETWKYSKTQCCSKSCGAKWSLSKKKNYHKLKSRETVVTFLFLKTVFLFL